MSAVIGDNCIVADTHFIRKSWQDLYHKPNGEIACWGIGTIATAFLNRASIAALVSRGQPRCGQDVCLWRFRLQRKSVTRLIGIDCAYSVVAEVKLTCDNRRSWRYRHVR